MAGPPTISTHVLDTGRGRPAVGVHVTLYRLADDGKPIRLTPVPDRRRRTHPRPARTAADGRRLSARLQPRAWRLLRADERRPAHHGRHPELSRPVADVAVLDVDLPRQLNPGPISGMTRNASTSMRGVPGRAERDELDRVRPARRPRPCRHHVPWLPARAMQVHGRHVHAVDVQLRAAAARRPSAPRSRPPGP